MIFTAFYGSEREKQDEGGDQGRDPVSAAFIIHGGSGSGFDWCGGGVNQNSLKSYN